MGHNAQKIYIEHIPYVVVNMGHSQMAETLEAAVVTDAKELAEASVKGFKPSASIKFLDKNGFVKKRAKLCFEGDQDVAYNEFMGSRIIGFFDPIKNEAIYTLREDAPSYKTALKAAVHEVYGHGYINGMRAVKDCVELKKKMMGGEASEKETAKADLSDPVFQLADEGFAHWVTYKVAAKIESDKKHFAKYDQTRLDAWALLEHEPSNETSDKSKEPSDDEVFQNSECLYRVAAKFGLAIYSEIEKKFGEKAVPLAAKACLDVPLDEIVSDEMAEFHIASKGTPALRKAGVLCSKYVEKRLKSISDYSGSYPNDPADFEKKARELANSCEKPTHDVDEMRYLYSMQPTRIRTTI